jgi:putative transposase
MACRTEVHFIKVGHPLYQYCDDTCRKSKNLYNYANYLIRQQFFYLETFLPYDGKEDSLYFQIKHHETYKALPAQTAQQTLRKLEDNWHSFFAAMRAWRNGRSRFLGMPKPPRYKEKNGRFTTFFTSQQCEVVDGHIRFPKTKLAIKTNVSEVLQEVRIVPEGNRYKIEIVHEHLVPTLLSPDPKRIASIDLGLNNLVTMTNNIGEQPIVINGKIAKSINQYYNKKRAKLMRNVGVRGTSDRLWKLTMKRNHKIGDLMHKASYDVVQWCIEYNIDTIVVGKNDGWKQGINIGKRNNQHFVAIPFENLLQKLAYKCEDAGSYLDSEQIGTHETYLGRRVSRGLFRSATGTTINADVNGSYNIMRKAFPNASFNARGDRRCALHPVRIDIT